MAEVRLKQAWKRFGETAVIHGVDLELASGEFIVFVGPSGCGKSTLLRMIAGLEEVSDGEIHIGGRDVTHVEAVDRGIAMVFQTYALYPHMTVEQNMGFGLKMAGADKREIRRKVDHAASLLQLDELLDRKPKNLSGGQRQRVAIGRAIVREPDVFLFDEPLSNLDAELRVEMRLQIAKLHDSMAATMIYVTHDQIEAMTMADRIVVLRAGRVEQIGTPLELYHHPENLFVAGFIGSPRMNLVEVDVLGGDAGSLRLRLHDGQEVTLPVDGSNAVAGSRATLGMRPEDLGEGSGGFTLEMRVEVAERLGGTTYLYGPCGGLDNFVVQRAGLDPTRSGERVAVPVQLAQCHAFDAEGLAFPRLAAAGSAKVA